MFGSGLIKGLGVTLREFILTYVDDIKHIPSRYSGGRGTLDQSSVDQQTGLFTIQYPEERRKLPERFRYIPMLIYEAETNEDRCTACGICAKVCPPQCIWMVRDRDEKGKPITRPSEFWIDTTICMNCGLCAEFCPFDAIKMNHDFEIAATDRMPKLIFGLPELRVPTTYYAKIRPSEYTAEEQARAAEAERKAAARAQPARPAGESAPTAAAPEAAAAPVAAKRSPEEIERLKAEAVARRAARAAEGSVTETPAPAQVTDGSPAAAPRKLSPEEVARLKAEAAAKRAARDAGGQSAETAAPPAGAAEPPSAQAPAGPRKLSPEEVARLKAEAAAKRAARDAGTTAEASVTPEAPASEAPAVAQPPAGPRKLSPEEVARLKAEAAARRTAKADAEARDDSGDSGSPRT